MQTTGDLHTFVRATSGHADLKTTNGYMHPNLARAKAPIDSKERLTAGHVNSHTFLPTPVLEQILEIVVTCKGINGFCPLVQRQDS